MNIRPSKRTHADTIRSLHDRATNLETHLRVFSRFLADQMEELHGREFRVEIDHDDGFIVIRAAGGAS